ncbi:MAG: RNA methyltransferase [Lachnospiraceae bacterium]|jgi:TrmH family RNA methyltransferase|nr:RNA methyltransferase [Lachnospiraceae bacterium]
MITSLSNPKVKELILLRDKPRARNKSGLFVAEGLKMFEEAPASNLQEVYLSRDLWEQLEKEERHLFIWKKLRECIKGGITVEQVAPEVFRKASDTRTPQGILFVGRQLSYSLEELIKAARERQRAGGRPPLFLLLEDIQDPGNLGTMLRTGEGAGADAVIMSRKTVDIYNPKTIRSTMGALYREPFVYVEGLGQAIALLRQYQIPVYAAHLKGRQYFDELSYEKGGAFLIGNEGNGLRRETAEQADIWVKIPMEGKAESLNAAVAAALLMYQASGYFRRSKRSKAT